MGAKQPSFSDYEQSSAKKRSKKKKFLAEMGQVVTRQPLVDLIEPIYPKVSSKGGRPSYPLATMLRIHLMQEWYSLRGPAMDDALIEVATIRSFAGIDVISDRIADGTKVLDFSHLLEKNN